MTSEAEAAVARAIELHRETVTTVAYSDGKPHTTLRCAECGRPAPCPTRVALAPREPEPTDPHRLARDYLDRLRTTDPSARVLAVIDKLKADMARACEVCDDYGVLDGLDPCPEGCRPTQDPTP